MTVGVSPQTVMSPLAVALLMLLGGQDNLDAAVLGTPFLATVCGDGVVLAIADSGEALARDGGLGLEEVQYSRGSCC